MDDKEQARGELLDMLHDAIVVLQDTLTVLYSEALAAEQADLAHQRGEQDRREMLERLRDASQQVIHAMADYHEAHADWVLQFE